MGGDACHPQPPLQTETLLNKLETSKARFKSNRVCDNYRAHIKWNTVHYMYSSISAKLLPVDCREF